MSEAERQASMNEESWLLEHYHRLSTEQAVLEADIAKVRKQRKALAARQRQFKKNGGDLPVEELAELERLTQSVTTIQKQLEQSRKQNKQHQSNMQDYTAKTGIQLIPPGMQGPRAPMPGPIAPMSLQQQGPMVMHQVRPPGMPQYHPAIGPPGQPGPYPPSVMMSPKREDHYGMPNGQQPFAGEPFYPEQHLSSPPRPVMQQQQRFAVPQHPGKVL